MSETEGPKSWSDDLASLVDDSGVRYPHQGVEMEREGFESFNPFSEVFAAHDESEQESLKDQVKGFLFASAELLHSLAKGCGDIIEQNILNEESFFAKKIGRRWAVVSGRLSFLNEYLPEDKDPTHAWPVILSVFFMALIVLIATTERKVVLPPRKVHICPPNALHIQLPDGRQVSFREQGVPADRARISLIVIHSFLSSRIAGIPGIRSSLLEDFGVRMITYDLPGFGESDRHPRRTLNSSAVDLMNIADALGIKDKFWIAAHSSGAMHAWAALRYFPEKVAGASFFAPMGNPYDSKMTKQEKANIWSNWTQRMKFMCSLARRFPILLPYLYRHSFLSGIYRPPNEWLHLSVGRKDITLIEESNFVEHWERDFAESIRQGNPRPFMEEAALQASDWSFSLAHIRVRKYQINGFLHWFKSMYDPPKAELAGFLGPIHIWQQVPHFLRLVPL